MRLFAGVLPPPAALAELDEAVKGLRALPGADRLRWLKEETWHFTMAFYGEVDEGLLPELTERLSRVARRREAPQMRIAGGGRFGDRSLWAGVAGDRLAFTRLAQSSSAAGRRTGLPMEDRPFKAHLSLARSRTLDRSGRGEATVDLRPYQQALDTFEGTTWPADTLRLIRSNLHATGDTSRYETVEHWPLSTP